MLLKYYTDKVEGGSFPYDTNECYSLEDFSKEYESLIVIDVTPTTGNSPQYTAKLVLMRDLRTGNLKAFLRQEDLSDPEGDLSGYWSVLQWSLLKF